MKNATHFRDKTIESRIGHPAVLKKRWEVAPGESTSRNVDQIIKHKSESDVTKQAGSSSSLLFSHDDTLETMLRDFSAYHQSPVNKMLQAIEYIVEAPQIDSTDTSTPALDYYSRQVDEQSARDEVQGLFSLAAFIDLEPGMENAFSQGIEYAIERHGESAISEIQSIILEERTKSSIAMEALQYIGRMDSHHWKTQRRKLLEQCLLRSRSAWVRDGAGLGLASLDDPQSIDAVRTAIARESSNTLKHDLESVLEQLEATNSES